MKLEEPKSESDNLASLAKPKHGYAGSQKLDPQAPKAGPSPQKTGSVASPIRSGPGASPTPVTKPRNNPPQVAPSDSKHLRGLESTPGRSSVDASAATPGHLLPTPKSTPIRSPGLKKARMNASPKTLQFQDDKAGNNSTCTLHSHGCVCPMCTKGNDMLVDAQSCPRHLASLLCSLFT